ATNSLGVYPCCGVKTLRFDPFRLSTGCKFRDHVIGSANEDATRAATLPTKAESAADSDEGDAEANGGSCGPPLSVQQILLAKRDAVCVPPPEKPEERSLADVDIFGNEYLLLYPTQKPKQQKHLHTSRSSAAAAVLEPLCVDEDHRGGAGGDTDASDDSGEDECTGDAEDAGAGRQQPRGKVGGSGAVGCANKSEKKPARQRVTLQTGAILLHAPSFSCKKSGRWDANRSSRANQDYQRQDDRRRMSQIMDYLVKLRTATAGDNQRTLQPEKAAKQKEYSSESQTTSSISSRRRFEQFCKSPVPLEPAAGRLANRGISKESVPPAAGEHGSLVQAEQASDKPGHARRHGHQIAGICIIDTLDLFQASIRFGPTQMQHQAISGRHQAHFRCHRSCIGSQLSPEEF
uniref:SCA7 domain-containing protein n=1 Tax=Macrostomum lignano TaxID=282301 RepID=A0A1I8IP48_9PLAT